MNKKYIFTHNDSWNGNSNNFDYTPISVYMLHLVIHGEEFEDTYGNWFENRGMIGVMIINQNNKMNF